VLTITSELLKSWELPNFIPSELLPMEVIGLFDAPISFENKVRLLLHEEVLGRKGMVYVAAKAARRACTVTGWDHPDSLRALDLCVEGKEVSREELERAVNAANEAARAIAEAAFDASVSDVTRDVWAARAAVFAAGAALGTWTVSDAWDATTCVWDTTDGFSEKERKSQLTDCRDWLLRENPQERTPILTRYQRIMRSLCSQE
jgi:hypothetical protein